MPIRVANTTEKDVVLVPQNPFVLVDSTPKQILSDATITSGEIAGRYIQNVGANDCYYSFGHTCDPTNFCGILSKPANVNSDGFGSGQQLDASNCGQALWVYSRGGTTLSITLLKRNDMDTANGARILSFGTIS